MTPDFDQIARRISNVLAHDVWADVGVIEGMKVFLFIELRQMWNARGAADSQAVDDAELTAPVAELVRAAIRALDR